MLLTAVGGIIIFFAVLFICLGLVTEKVEEKIHDNERITFTLPRGNRRRYNLIVPLKHKCKIHVQLNATSGPFDFYVEDFVGAPVPLPNEEWHTKPYYIAKSLPRGGSVSFTLDLEAGNYNFVFYAPAHIEPQATLTSTVTYAVRPLQKLLDVGLQLLEVGMPVLITGVVLYLGLASTI